MNDEMSASTEYIHGSSPEEQHRLSMLNDILNESCLRELNLQPGEKVLDLGSGLGQFTRLMAQTVGGQTDVVGIERDPDQIAQARRLAESSGEAGLVEFREGEATEVPLRSSEWGSFDVAHARFLLEHVSRPELVIEQMARSVRAGGSLSATMTMEIFVPGPSLRASPPFGGPMSGLMRRLAMTHMSGAGLCLCSWRSV